MARAAEPVEHPLGTARARLVRWMSGRLSVPLARACGCPLTEARQGVVKERDRQHEMDRGQACGQSHRRLGSASGSEVVWQVCRTPGQERHRDERRDARAHTAARPLAPGRRGGNGELDRQEQGRVRAVPLRNMSLAPRSDQVFLCTVRMIADTGVARCSSARSRSTRRATPPPDPRPRVCPGLASPAACCRCSALAGERAIMASADPTERGGSSASGRRRRSAASSPPRCLSQSNHPAPSRGPTAPPASRGGVPRRHEVPERT